MAKKHQQMQKASPAQKMITSTGHRESKAFAQLVEDHKALILAHQELKTEFESLKANFMRQQGGK
jgi:hypothetical protein